MLKWQTMVNHNTLSGRIKRARTLSGLSQKELAHKLGFSDKTVSAYETERAIPPLPTIRQIADITGVSLEELVNGEVKNGVHRENKDAIEEKLDLILNELRAISKKI